MNAPALSQMGWIISMGKKPTYQILRKTINFNILRVVFLQPSPSATQNASKLSEASQDFKKATSERNLNFLSSRLSSHSTQCGREAANQNGATEKSVFVQVRSR